ncbi:hypothetical protein BZL54_23170 [Burkholderia ubonensis subsp. mesacidophila]|uniref:Type IV secretion system protein DotC n=2 Tax=Burkholderia ubonensis TaxID=101571 RepID=A0A2A4FCK5_9BURK|nr:hypothetical protein BZL54_23170 [Burkholderia ubonensis subsp. mesacidophila]
MAGCLMAGHVHAEMSLDDLANLSVDSMPAAAAISPARANMLSEAALPLGSHRGLADRSAVLVAELEARASRLDTIYRFNALVMTNGVLPPVISEARDAIEATNDQIRVADRMYKIIAPARFITIAPSWRDYLLVGLRIKPVQELPFAAVLPKTGAERAYWKEQIMLGYAQGQKLADQILETNRARLDRDYIGMLRYSELLNKGMVSEPSVAVAPSIVSGDRNQLNVGDTLYRVTDHGGFVTDPGKWQATVGPATGTSREGAK